MKPLFLFSLLAASPIILPGQDHEVSESSREQLHKLTIRLRKHMAQH